MPLPKAPNSSAALALDALGNETRREIVRLIGQRPRSVGEIAAELPISRPAVSKHLRALTAANLVRSTAKGNRNVYRIEPGGFEAARAWLDGFWDEALARFAMVANNVEP